MGRGEGTEAGGGRRAEGGWEGEGQPPKETVKGRLVGRRAGETVLSDKITKMCQGNSHLGLVLLLGWQQTQGLSVFSQGLLRG